MTHSEFIAKSVYEKCIEAGCNHQLSKESSAMAVRNFHSGNHKSPSQLIIDTVTSAKKLKGKKVSKSWK